MSKATLSGMCISISTDDPVVGVVPINDIVPAETMLAIRRIQEAGNCCPDQGAAGPQRIHVLWQKSSTHALPPRTYRGLAPIKKDA